MQLTAQDKKAAREGFAYVVIRGGKRVCYASTLGEAKRECGKTGRVVSISGMRYASQNPLRGSVNVRNPSNAATNRAFLNAIDAATRNKILSSIGKHYDITAKEAMAEVTDAEAEHLLDYMVEPMRSATYVIMQRHGFGFARRNPSLNVRNPSLNVRNPSLTAADKRVIVAFTEHRADRSRLLSTDGQRLDGNYMGGSGIATWEGGKIHFHDLGGKTSQTVQRAIAKEAPRNWLARNPSLNVRNPSGAKQRARGVRGYDDFSGAGDSAALAWAAQTRREMAAAKRGRHGDLDVYRRSHAGDIATSSRHRPLRNPADFASLSIGQEFDFVSGSTVDSFYDRCVKTSSRTYMPIEGKLKGKRLLVGSVKAKVYHVGSSNPSLNVRNPSGAKQRAHGTRKWSYRGVDEKDYEERRRRTVGHPYSRKVEDAMIARAHAGEFLRDKYSSGLTRAKARHAEALSAAKGLRPSLPNPSAAGVGHSVGKHTKYAARGAGRVAKSAWKGTKSFLGSAYSSFKKHNPSLNVR